MLALIYAICLQSFGSQSWDASLAIQALIASDLTNEIGPGLARGHDFLKKSQVRFSILKSSFCNGKSLHF